MCCKEGLLFFSFFFLWMIVKLGINSLHYLLTLAFACQLFQKKFTPTLFCWGYLRHPGLSATEVDYNLLKEIQMSPILVQFSTKEGFCVNTKILFFLHIWLNFFDFSDVLQCSKKSEYTSVWTLSIMEKKNVEIRKAKLIYLIDPLKLFSVFLQPLWSTLDFSRYH